MILLIVTVLVLLIGLIKSLPYWREKDAYKKGMVYVCRRNAGSTFVQFCMDLALIAINVVDLVTTTYLWWVSLVVVLVLCWVAYFNWRMWRYWRRRQAMAEQMEIDLIQIPDYPEEP